MNLPEQTYNVLIIVLLLALLGLLAFNTFVTVSTNNGLSVAFGTKITAFPQKRSQQEYVEV